MVFTWNDDAHPSQKAVFVIGYILGTLTLITSCWCFNVILSAKKLRKPLWLFRASLSVKDIVLCVVVLVTNLTSSDSTKLNNQAEPSHRYIATIILTSISSSIFTMLCISLDRYHAATRPFRYHIGHLMPTGVSIILIFYCWIMGLATGFCCVWDYSRKSRKSYGILLLLVSLEKWQKALLLSGLTFVLCVSACQLFLSLSHVMQQKRESRFRIERGEDEPVRSRKNSTTEEPPTASTTCRSDSESEANQFFLRKTVTEAKSAKPKNRKWSLMSTQDASFFTPTSYRPSILRRIRDTWYLYVAVINWSVLFVTTLLPTFYLITAGGYCIHDDIETSSQLTNKTIITVTENLETTTSLLPIGSNSHCVMNGISECLLLSHGFICVITYIFADDVFRPKFLKPIKFLLKPCVQRRNRQRHGSVYSSGRKRTSSKISNFASFSA